MLHLSSKNNTKGHSFPSFYIPKTLLYSTSSALEGAGVSPTKWGSSFSSKSCTTFLHQALGQENLFYLLHHLLFIHLLIYLVNKHFINTYVEGTF